MKKGKMNLDLIMGGIAEVIAFLLFLLIMGGVIWFLYAVHTTIHITGTISNIVFLLLSGIPIGIVLYIFWPVLNLDKETENKFDKIMFEIGDILLILVFPFLVGAVVWLIKFILEAAFGLSIFSQEGML